MRVVLAWMASSCALSLGCSPSGPKSPTGDSPNVVRDEDCHRWVDHSFDVVKQQIIAAMTNCPEKKQNAMKAVMEKEFPKDKAEAFDECKVSVGQKYDAAEESCS